MKFLLFNVIVAGALVYLFGAGPTINAVRDGAAAVTAQVDEALESIQMPASDIARKAPGPVAESKQTPRTTVAPETEQNAQNALPPIEEAIDVPTLPEHSVPSRTKAETALPAASEVAKFMTPKERWRELNRLAHDMELMYADKTTR